MEMLEKRVKSRFSHRHIFIFPNDNIKPVDNLKVRLIQLLSVPLSLIRKHGGTKKKRGGRRKSMGKWFNTFRAINLSVHYNV